MNEKKLIYLLNQYSPRSSSHFFHVIRLLEQLAENGVSIALIVEKGMERPPLKSANIEWIPLEAVRLPRRMALAWILFRLHRNAFKKIFIRIAWPAALVAVFVALFTGQQVYFWHSSQGNREHYRSVRPGWRKTKLWISTQLPMTILRKSLYRLVTGPESMKKYYQEQFRFDPEKILILYNDIDTNRFYPVSTVEKKIFRQKLDLPENVRLILFVHRFSPVRKTAYYFPFILDRFFEDQYIGETLFLMIGGGPEKNKMADQIRQRPYARNVRFLDEIPNAEIAAYYQAGDIFIQPSYAEGFPRTLLEAMACGLPVVTTDAGGIRDILGPVQKTFMVEKTDRQGFADSLHQMARSAEHRTSCREENLLQVRRFDTPLIAKQYIQTLFTPKD